MYWLRISLLLIASPAWALEGYILGGGAEADTADGLSTTLIADFGLDDDTWLSVAYARSTSDLPRGLTLTTSYGDIGLDHMFDPVGIRLGLSYWGDNEILDSIDTRGSLYWRGKRQSLALELEFRDFEFDIPSNDFLPRRDIQFNAKGIGFGSRFDLGDKASLGVSGMHYDYNVNLRLAPNQGIVDLLSVSRLSLINSLIDYRANVRLGIDAGDKRWSVDVATWEGSVDGSKTVSTTLSFLAPLGKKNDIEFSLGVDDSDTYGSVTLFSVFLFFYGAP
jgi:hypothetical protein